MVIIACALGIAIFTVKNSAYQKTFGVFMEEIRRILPGFQCPRS